MSDQREGLRLGRLELAALKLAAGPLTLEIGQVVLHDVVAAVRIEAGGARLDALDAASADLSGVKVQASASDPSQALPAAAAAGSWSLGPLAAAEGVVQAEIVDATLLFDADVKVPIRQGQVDFNEATVAHVGPDSRMGVSRMGIYVDAPNGRSYLYQFAATPVAGVEFEKRSALPGPWGTKRGHLWLQPFLEAVLGQPPRGPGAGITEQARQLLARTAVSGHVQLGDGWIAAPGVQAELTGRAAGHNVARLNSKSVGRGLDLSVASLSARDAVLRFNGMHVACDAVTGEFVLQFAAEGTGVRAGIDAAAMKLSGLRLRRAGA